MSKRSNDRRRRRRQAEREADPEFAGFQRDRRKMLHLVREALDNESLLPLLERTTDKLVFIVPSLGAAEGDAGRFLWTALPKLCHELQGFCACCRAASLDSAYHHLRGILELHVAFEHIRGAPTPSKRQRRLQRYRAFARFGETQFALRVRFQIEGLPADFVAKTLGLEELWRRTGEFDHWRKLYKPRHGDLFRVRHWHSPVTIEQMFEPLGHDTWQLYENICHMVHVSPIGHRLSNPEAPSVIGFPRDMVRLNQTVAEAALFAGKSMHAANELLGDDKLVPGLMPEAGNLMEGVKKFLGVGMQRR